jgi:cytochrome c553
MCPALVAASVRDHGEGDKRRTPICATCHLANSRARQDSAYRGSFAHVLVRQLLAFKNGARTGEAMEQMKPTENFEPRT